MMIKTQGQQSRFGDQASHGVKKNWFGEAILPEQWNIQMPSAWIQDNVPVFYQVALFSELSIACCTLVCSFQCSIEELPSMHRNE